MNTKTEDGPLYFAPGMPDRWRRLHVVGGAEMVLRLLPAWRRDRQHGACGARIDTAHVADHLPTRLRDLGVACRCGRERFADCRECEAAPVAYRVGGGELLPTWFPCSILRHDGVPYDMCPRCWLLVPDDERQRVNDTRAKIHGTLRIRWRDALLVYLRMPRASAGA